MLRCYLKLDATPKPTFNMRCGNVDMCFDFDHVKLFTPSCIDGNPPIKYREISLHENGTPVTTIIDFDDTRVNIRTMVVETAFVYNSTDIQLRPDEMDHLVNNLDEHFSSFPGDLQSDTKVVNLTSVDGITKTITHVEE